MEIILFIIISAVISIISAVVKKTPKAENGEQAPPRPIMSDIQKAFMLANDFDERQRRAEQAAQRSAHSPYSAQNADFVNSDEPSVEAEPVRIDGFYDAPVEHVTENLYAHVQIDRYFADEPDTDEFIAKSATPSAPHQKLGLFEDKNEVLRALIYAEILPRRGTRRR